MPKELFNQPLINSPAEPDDNDRIGFGQPDIEGGKNMLWSRFKEILQSIVSAVTNIDFIPQLTPPSEQEGRIYYDNVKKAIILFDDIAGTSIELSYEIPVRVLNNSGAIIQNGKAVYINGAVSMRPTIRLADCCEYEKSRIIGIATHNIANGTEGKIVYFGVINDYNTSAWALGDILYLKKDSPGDFTTDFPSGGQFVVRVGTVTNVSATEGSIQLNISSSDYTEETIKETGFPDRGNVKLSFDDVTRVFTIEPTDSIKTRYYERGIKYIITNPQTVTLPDEVGLYLIYYQAEVLSYIKDANPGQIDTIIRNNPTVSYIAYNDDDSEQVYFANELHNSIGFGEVNHSYQHFTEGAKYLSGLGLGDFNLGNGSQNIHAQFSIEGGGITDEDLPTFATAKAVTEGLPIYWFEDVAGTIYTRRIILPGYSVIQLVAGERLRFNNPSTGTLDLVANNDFVCCHIFACNAYNEPYKQIAICGQAQYVNGNSARDGAKTEIFNLLSGNLPTPEFVPIGTVIFQTGNYANDNNGRIVQSEDIVTGDLVDYLDWRKTNSFGGGSGSGESIVEFSDSQFKVYNDSDITKVFKFDASGISTANERSYTMPDKNGTIALLDDVQTNTPISFYQYDGLSTGATPGAGIFRMSNVVTPSSSTAIYFNITQFGNVQDLEALLIKLKSGSVITASNRDDITQFITATLTADATLSAGVVTMLITINSFATISNSAVLGFGFLSAGDGSSNSVEKDPFTESISIASLLQHSPNYTQSTVLNIIKTTDVFIGGTYQVLITTDGKAINFSNDFIVFNNDYSILSVGTYLFLFAYLPNGKIGVTINNTNADIIAPTIQSASVSDGSANDWVLIMSEAVTATNLGYTPKINGINATVTGIAGSGTTQITLTTTEAVVQSDVLTLDYLESAGDTEDTNGNPLADVTGFSVTNNVAGAYLLEETFTGTVIDSAKWAIDNIGGNMSQNDVLLCDRSIATQYGLASQITFDNLGVKVFRFDIQATSGANGAETSSVGFLDLDKASNAVRFQYARSGLTAGRARINIVGTTIGQNQDNVILPENPATGQSIKIWLDLDNDIQRLYMWSGGAWVQFGTDGSAVISNPMEVGMLTSPAISLAETSEFDNFYVTDYDFSTLLP